jgi:hypothetical protein
MAMTIREAARNIRRTVTEFFRAGSNTLEDTALAIRERMNKPGKQMEYPAKWDSGKQQAAFFATNGFGGGIPYKRQGNMEKAFTVTPGFGSATLSAPHPAGAVFGSPKHEWWQSRLHVGRWTWLKTVYLEEVAKIPERFRERFKLVIK